MSARFPRGATFDFVCPKYSADWKGWSSHNVKNGTSTARGSPAQNTRTFLCWGGWVGIPNSEFRISRIQHPNPIVEITHD